MPIDPNVDFPGFLKEAVAEQVALATNGGLPTQATAGNEAFELNLGGQTYKYENKAAAEAALNNFMGAVSNQMQDLTNKANTPAPVGEGSFVSGNEKQDWNESNDKQFVELMTKSPKEGLDYWLNQRIFDGQSADPVADLKRTLTETENTKRTIAAYQFKENHPEFPGGQQAAQIIEKFRQDMNLPYDYNGIEAAYFIAMNRGAIPDYKAQAAQQQFQQRQQQAAQQQNQGQQYQQFTGYEQANAFQPQNSPFAPENPFNPAGGNSNPFLGAPPGVNRNNPNFGGQIDLESLSLEQLEALATKANMFRR